MLLAAMTGMYPVTAAEPDVAIAADVVLKNGTVIDGTGAPRRRADLAIRGDRIVGVGNFPVDSKARVIDASAWIVAPGFIDLHSHSDGGIVAPRTRANRNFQAQGVT